MTHSTELRTGICGAIYLPASAHRVSEPLFFDPSSIGPPTTDYRPEYFTSRTKEAMFGDLGQEPFLRASSQAIDLVAQMVLKGRGNVPFQDLLGQLSQIRSRLAQETNTRGAHLFGVRRHEQTTPFTFPSLTFDGQYALAGARIGRTVFPLFAKALAGKKSLEKTFCTSFTFSEQDSPVSSYKLELYSHQALQKSGLDVIHWRCGMGQSPADKLVEPISYAHFLKTQQDVAYRDKVCAAFKEFKRYEPETLGQSYHGIKLASIIRDLKTFYTQSEEKTHFLVFSLRHQVLGKLYATTQYVTWLHRIPGEDLQSTLERAQIHSKFRVIHQDIFLVEDTLRECEALFERVLAWDDSEGLDELKERMAPLIYLLTHNHRDIRGGAAANEWLERGIYKALGFHILAPTTRMVDLDAFANVYKDFVVEYKESFDLIPIEKNPEL